MLSIKTSYLSVYSYYRKVQYNIVEVENKATMTYIHYTIYILTTVYIYTNCCNIYNKERYLYIYIYKSVVLCWKTFASLHCNYIQHFYIYIYTIHDTFNSFCSTIIYNFTSHYIYTYIYIIYIHK